MSDIKRAAPAGDPDYPELSREHMARYPAIRAQLADMPEQQIVKWQGVTFVSEEVVGNRHERRAAVSKRVRRRRA